MAGDPAIYFCSDSSCFFRAYATSIFSFEAAKASFNKFSSVIYSYFEFFCRHVSYAKTASSWLTFIS